MSPSKDVHMVDQRKHGRLKQRKEKHRRRARCQPGRIGAQIARLPALQDRSGKGGRAAEQPRRAAQDSYIDDPFQNVLREAKQRLDDGCAIELVDKILVRQQLVAARQRRR